MDSNKKGLPIWRSEYVQVYVSCTLFTRCGMLLWLFWGKACINYLCTLFAWYSLFHEWFVTFTNRIWFDLWMVQLWNSMVQFEGVVACFRVCINTHAYQRLFKNFDWKFHSFFFFYECILHIGTAVLSAFYFGSVYYTWVSVGYTQDFKVSDRAAGVVFKSHHHLLRIYCYCIVCN